MKPYTFGSVWRQHSVPYDRYDRELNHPSLIPQHSTAFQNTWNQTRILNSTPFLCTPFVWSVMIDSSWELADNEEKLARHAGSPVSPAVFLCIDLSTAADWMSYIESASILKAVPWVFAREGGAFSGCTKYSGAPASCVATPSSRLKQSHKRGGLSSGGCLY